MLCSGLERAELPETGPNTLQRRCQGSQTAARTQAHAMREDLDSENGVVR